MTPCFHSSVTADAPPSHGGEIVIHYVRRWRWTVVGLALLAFVQSAGAQAWSYPAFQPPRIVEREFNIGVADGGSAGVSAVFQWREQTGPRSQISIDAGVADPPHSQYNTTLFVGGQYAHMLANATTETPIDFMLTAGVNVAINENAIFRIPAGIVVGHRFLLEGNLALTPFVHPRLSLDLCNDCVNDTEFGLVFDIGASLEVTRTISIRGSAFFGGSDIFDDDGFGISIAWTPSALATSPFRRKR
ncbi:MAG: hypothetical protein ACT4P6_03200 [Gemmatimonadaceae bacterium]